MLWSTSGATPLSAPQPRVTAWRTRLVPSGFRVVVVNSSPFRDCRQRGGSCPQGGVELVEQRRGRYEHLGVVAYPGDLAALSDQGEAVAGAGAMPVCAHQ